MPILMAKDTRSALGEGAERCESRSLLQQKLVFFDPEVSEYKQVALDLILSGGRDDLQRLRQDKQDIQRKQENDGKDGSERHRRAVAFLKATEPLLRRTKDAMSLRVPTGWLGCLPAARKREFALVTAERLVLGLSNGVLENSGLSLHRFFGVPFIPGSALKGVARDAADVVEKARTRKLELFGNEPEDGEARQGAVSFLPAYPVNANARLEYEVCTPHYRDYYSGNGKNPQALDTENPIPNLFPVVAKGAEFKFSILACGPRYSDAEASKLLDLAALCLKEALTTRGVGAKTAAGYGWFNEVSPVKQESTRAVPMPQSVPDSSPSQTDEEKLIQELRRLTTTTANFPALFPRLKAIADDALLKRIFNAVIPAQELRNTRLNSPYWQSFKSKPDGLAILRRVGLLPQ
jgi:CRISPR type III-B/RAMP module RAMP protein Cmr6